MLTALTMTPTKMATDLKIPWHNLACFCCAKLCRSKFRLFQFLPASLGNPCPIAVPKAGRWQTGGCITPAISKQGVAEMWLHNPCCIGGPLAKLLHAFQHILGVLDGGRVRPANTICDGWWFAGVWNQRW